MHSPVTAIVLLTQAALAASISPPYKKYDLVELCGRRQDKRSLYLREVAHQFTLNTTNRNINCHLELHLSNSDVFGFAIFIESMKLDVTSQGCSKDFIQFGRDFLMFTSYKSDKRCGIIPPAGDTLTLEDRKRREYIEATDKEMDVWISVRSSRQEKKELKLIVTPFKKKCHSRDNYYRKCPGTDRCIKRELFCDGIVNCDGQPKDEQEEFCVVNSSLGNLDIFPSIPIIILIVVFGIVFLMIIIFAARWISLALRRKTVERGVEAERRALRDPISSANALSSPSDSSRGLQALRSQLSSGSNTELSQPTAPLPFNPPSYSEVMGKEYKDDPPKYSEFPQESHQVIDKT